MKKFAIIAAVVTGFLGLTAAAEAGYYSKRIVGYHCGRPVYKYVYVETCQPRYYNSYRSSYRSNYYGGGGGYCRPSYGGYGYRSRCR